MLDEPINNVSRKPLLLIIFSVKLKPLSKSAAIWISSIATNSKSILSGIDSTVQKKYLAEGGIIFSSPVINATFFSPNSFRA